MHIKKILFIPGESLDYEKLDTLSTRTIERLEKGVLLWGNGQYEKIIVLGGIIFPPTIQTLPLAILMYKWLRTYGVPSQHILIEHRSLDTYKNVGFGHEILQTLGYGPPTTELTIVSQWQHAWRITLTARSYGYCTAIQKVHYAFTTEETLKEYLFMLCHIIDRQGTGILAQHNRSLRSLNTKQ